MSDSIQVAIKVRPLIKREKEENLQIQWSVTDNVIIPVDPEKKRGESFFQFDHIFDSEKTNNDVFEVVVKPIVDAAVKGFNGTVFAYGQTSSGKTHTMMGIPSEPGIIPMAVERTFDSIAETCGREFLLRVSYLEIYNEKVNDLLDTSATDLKLREDSNGLVQVLKCKEEVASSPDAIMAVMKKGDKNRRIGETEMNERSSRSHSIFRITIESRDQSSDSDGAIQVSQLNLVDLAGSERARQTNATGERFKEGTHINMSLSTLGLVIKQLSESDNSKYVNFRDSKLTRLLQASLGGNAMTTIICAVTPAAFEETQCTLYFASRAKSVKNKPQLNEVMSDAALLKRYKKQLLKLNEELEKLKTENRVAEVQEMESKLQEKEYKLQETDRINQLLEERIQLLKNGIISADTATKEDTSSKIGRSKRRRTWAGDRALNSRFSLCTRNLPTIKEISCTSPDSKPNSSENLDKINKRKSIIQTVNFNDESFETAFTDFELELIKVAKEREEQSDFTLDCIEEKSFSKIKPRSENRVKFQDDIEIYRISNESSWSNLSTPEKQKSNSNHGDTQELTDSPGTPKNILRERLNYLADEYKALQEFTTLERQVLYAQQADFTKPTEKNFMQRQIDELLERLQNYSKHQIELEDQLTVSLNCLSEFSYRTPDILEAWNPTLFNNVQNKAVVTKELKQLQELFADLKSDKNSSEKALTPLEKKLNNDYNMCLQELDQVKSQKESLFKENTEIKKKVNEESNKLKNANILIDSLRTDIDCLMEKLIKKNSELDKLRESIVELEKHKSSTFDSSSKDTNQETSAMDIYKDTNLHSENDILKLKEIINEQALQIIKYREFEEEIKKENELLQQTLYIAKQSKENDCTTNLQQNIDKENQKLSETIEEKILIITDYEKLVSEMRQKITNLEQDLDHLTNTQYKSEECQTEYVPIPDKENILLHEKNNEIIKLSNQIHDNVIEITNVKVREEQLMEQIKQLQAEKTILRIEKTSIECQTSYIQTNQEIDEMNYNLKKDTEIGRLEDIIQNMTVEVDKYKKFQEDAKIEIENLQQTLNNINSINKISIECQTEDSFKSLMQDNDNEEGICPEDSTKHFTKNFCNNSLNTEYTPNTNNESVSEYQLESNCKNMQDHNVLQNISKLSRIIEEKEVEITKYKVIAEELKKDMEYLQQQLNNKINNELVSTECQTDFIFNQEQEVYTNTIQEKDAEISRLTAINADKTQEIVNFNKLVEETKKEVRQLQECLNQVTEVSHATQNSVNTEPIYTFDKEKMESFEEEIVTLQKEISALKEESTNSNKNFESKIALLNEDLSLRIKDMETMKLLNSNLQNNLDEKTKEIVNLHGSLNSTVQNLEQQINIIELKRNELQEKLDFANSNNLIEISNLQKILDKLETENSNLKKYVETLEEQCNNRTIKLSTSSNENLILSPSKELSNTVIEDTAHHSLQTSIVKLEGTLSTISSSMTENVPSTLDEDNFVKPTVTIQNVKSDLTTADESNVLSDDKNFVKPLDKNFELESSSIFANQTYFDNMEVGQSFVQDSSALILEVDESKDVSNILVNNDTINIHQSSEDKSVVSLEDNKDESQIEDVPILSESKIKPDHLPIEELDKIRLDLEQENLRLRFDLEKKIHETEEVQRVLSDFKQTLEKLQHTLSILTNENMDMSRQLTDARESNSQIVSNFQKEIDALTYRLATITEEKVSIQSELDLLNEQFDNMRAITPVLTDDEMKHKFLEYQDKVKSLTEENISLSTNLMEKIEELEKVKESKVHEYDHECAFKERTGLLTEKIQCLENENIELSTELTEHIEECDKLKETADVLKQQLELYANQSSQNDINTDIQFFKDENARLTNDVIELRAKVTQLHRENTNLSTNLALEDNDFHNESQNTSHSNLNTSNVNAEATEETVCDQANISFSNKKIRDLQEQVEHLTLLNKKLGELKLTNCSQCAHLRELNDSRRELKLEVKSLNQKLADLQKKFQQKCLDTEVLRSKANEDLNATLSFMESTLNGSTYDCSNVTVIEEKVQNLHCELEELKENHSKLSNQYKEKCNELDKLQQYDNNCLKSPIDKKDTKRSKSDSSRKNSSRIQALQKDLDNITNDLQQFKSIYANIRDTINKIVSQRNETLQEVESLKLSNDQLKKESDTSESRALHFEEKVKLLEEELSTLYKRVEAANETEKKIQVHNLQIEVQLETLTKEKAELLSSLQEVEEKYIKELEESNNRVLKSDKENVNLRNELLKLEDLIKQKGKTENYMEEKLREETESAKSRIIKEIIGLTKLGDSDRKELSKKSVTEIFVSFLNTILSKETEIIKKLQEDFEKVKRKIEDEKQQCIDAEKRANNWAKTLETDLEKIQNDFTKQEQKNKRLQNENHLLEENLKEAQYENQQLHNNITNLESEVNSLHNELDKKMKNNIEKDSILNSVHEKERLARTKEEEWENRFKAEKEEHSGKVMELNSQLDSYKSISDDLRQTVEGLDLEIEHLKNTVDIKSNDLAASLRKIEEMQQGIEHFEEINQQLRNECLEKNKHVEDITGLLKIKCDLLTEYKTKVETMKPEYESLQSQISERKICIDKYKEEIHVLKLENKKQMDILQDKLSDEDIKSAGLNKQVAELKNKNTALYSTIEEFKDRCAELERENTNLQRKVRNSTSKIRVESEMQELQDENRSLKNHLEGSYNRIKELQESKSQVQRELTEMKGKHELLEQELNTTNIALTSLREKYNNVNLQKLREKYETLLREKNSIILEVEEKKMLLANKDQKLVEYSIEMDTLKKQKEVLDKEIESIKKEKSSLEIRISDLIVDKERLVKSIEECTITKDEQYKLVLEEKNTLSKELINCQKEMSDILIKNQELDEEMNDMVNHIHKQENEIDDLRDQLITGSSTVTMDKMKTLEDDNEKLKTDLRIAEVNRSKIQNEIIRLNSEKELLHSRVEDLSSQIAELESKNSSRSSSKNTSPTTQKGRRRHRRSDLYNQNRKIEKDDDSKEFDYESPSITPTPTQIQIIEEECHSCYELRNRIREMSLDLVSRNSKITMLEVQLEAENFPYQMKCNELQENLLQVNTKNSELKLEIQKIQRALMKDSSRECQICRQRKLSKTNQAVQVSIGQESTISMAGISSGIVEDHVKLLKMEKERNWMKDLCRSRARKIKDLEQRIKDLEELK